MANADLIYGDRNALATVPTGRPTVLFAIGDSIINKWWPAFAMRLKGIVGYDNAVAGLYHLSDGLTPPTSPGAYVAKYREFNCYARSGSSTLTSATIVGATSIPIAPVTGGLPDYTMPMVIGTGGTQETITPDITYVGGVALATPIISSTPLAFAHAAGTPISWQRPSGQTAYWPGNALEVVFATAASPQSATWVNNRLLDCVGMGDSVQNFGDPTEGTIFSDGYFLGRYSIDVILFYLALPVNTGAPNLRLLGRSCESSPQQATADFSIYAAVPTIKAVMVTIPAPITYLSTCGWRATVTSPNVGNFTAGQVFVALSVVTMRHGATSGTVVMNATAGGLQFQDILGDPTRYGPMWTTAWRKQFIAAMATTPIKTIDQYLVHLGQNNTPTNATSIFTSIQQTSTDMKAANPAVVTIYVSDYLTVANLASGSATNMSAATQLIEGQPQIVGFDQAAMPDVNSADMNSLYLADGVHPNTIGTTFAANRIANFYQAASTGVKAILPTMLVEVLSADAGGGSYNISVHTNNGNNIIQSATVLIQSGGTTVASGVSDTFGNYVTALPTGSYTVSVLKTGFANIAQMPFVVS